MKKKDKIQQMTKEFAKKNNIGVFDMLPYFKSRNINNTFYFEIDGHWNEKGHALASELLYDYLVDNKIVK